MKFPKSLLLIFSVLLLASLACLGSTSNNPPADNSGSADNAAPAEDAEESTSAGGADLAGDAAQAFETVGIEIPTDGVSNFMIMGEGVNFAVEGTLEDMLAFFQDSTAAAGLTERTLLTSITEGGSSQVFDGHPTGKALVIQMVDLGDGTINVNVRLEDV